MLSVIQDVRYSIRSLTQNPSLVFFALVALALGIGANTAVFSVVNGILLTPLPYAKPERLVRLWDSNPPDLPAFSVAPGNFFEWEKQNRVFGGLGAYREDGFSLSGGSGESSAERVTGARITAGLLPVLGVSPAIGRWFTAEEDRPGAARVVLLGNDLWRGRFGSNRSIVGTTVRLEGEPYTVVGVMPPGFRVPIEGAELWIPYALDSSNADRSSHFLRVLARLNDKSTIDQARLEMNRIAQRLEEQDSQTRKGWQVRILPLGESITGDIGKNLWILLGAVGLVLLIASANVANLHIARCVSRRKEIALRLSLGASRARLLRQLLIESLVLSISGALLGIGLAAFGLDLLKTLAPDNIPRLADASIDQRVLAFTGLLAIASGLLFGVGPAMRASGLDLTENLKTASYGSTGRNVHRAGKLLVVGQITIAMVVVISSGLMVRTLWNLYAVDPGFQTQGRLTFTINLNSAKYALGEARSAFIAKTVAQLRAVPGVRNVAATHRLPMTGNSAFGIEIEGRPLPQPGQLVSVSYRSITRDYFDVMGIPIVRGRTFDRREEEDSGEVVVINQRMAAQLWPGEDPVGKRIRTGPQSVWQTVIGVVADSKERALDTDSAIGMYVPYSAFPVPAMIIIVQTSTNPNSIAGSIRQEIQRLDTDLAVAGLRPLGEIVAASIGERSFTAALLGIFAGIAVLLAVSGIYGVLAYAVNQRIREIGVRMALGANRGTVLKHIVSDGLRLVFPGVLVGTLAALAATRLLNNLLFGVKAADPLTFVALAAVLIFIGTLACYIPARKAASVDPLVALRNE